MPAVKWRKVTPGFVRTTSEPNTSSAAADAGVSTALFIGRINDGRNFYKSANGFSYSPLLDEATPYTVGYKNRCQ